MKRAAANPRIRIREKGGEWVDISSYVRGYSIRMEIGELYTIDLRVAKSVVEIDGRDPNPRKPATEHTIRVCGVDVSDHVGGYSTEVRYGELDWVTLEFQADEEVLRISGETPWG